MILVVQRVTQASVSIAGRSVASIGPGMLLLAGLEKGDSEGALEKAALKIVHLRIFDDEAGKLNESILESGGEILCVSQFTLAGDIRRGNRPSFDDAMPPDEAAPMFDRFVQKLRENGLTVRTGVFGAKMHVALVNDGPVTLLCRFP